MRRLAPLLIAATPLMLAASAPVELRGQMAEPELARVQTEVRVAEADLRRLERAASKARGEAAKLAAERQAAAAAIAASEAEISAADTRVRLAEERVARQELNLAEKQAPAAALVAGIVSMGRRPPLLSIASSSSLDEFVKVRTLLDTMLPVIRARSEGLSRGLEQSRRLHAFAAAARQQLADSRRELGVRQQRFSELEEKANQQASRLGAGALGAADILVASSESEARMLGQAQRRQAGLRLAAELGGLPPAPPRPGPSPSPKPVLAYQLPVAAPVTTGLGAVSETGIRARGITLAAFAGQAVTAPANGTIAFAGPFRRHDGVVIIDHGGGWMTLMTGVRTDFAKGSRAKLGAPLGRALGQVTVELSINGTPVSAALIARSSQMVSNGAKTG